MHVADSEQLLAPELSQILGIFRRQMSPIYSLSWLLTLIVAIE